MSNLKRMSSFKLEKTIENYILFINQSINQSLNMGVPGPP